MNPKKRVSSIFIFISVFFGSIMGAGITMLSTPKSGKDLRKKIVGTTTIVKEEINYKIKNTTRNLSKSSGFPNLKEKLGGINNIFTTLKDRIKKLFFK